MPGCLIAMGRLNRPAIMVYGGTIRAGCTENFPQLDIVSAFQSYGEKVYDRITEEERQEIVENACPGPGACGGMYTANTMATAIEALGMSLPYSSSTPADDPLKIAECKLAGDAILNLLKLDLKPRDIMTKKAFENAIRIVLVLGGSTNAVLHLIAMVSLTLKFSILRFFFVMWSGALDSFDVLQPYSITSLASHITTILISTLLKHINIST